MQVRMQMQVLTPGVQHREESDGCSQMPRVGRDGEQRLGSSAKEDRVNLFRIRQRETRDVLRQSKHHVKIRDGQELRLALREPPGAGRGLALVAMSIAARVI